MSTSEFLYQTFYPYKKFDDPNDCILEIKQWMLTADNLVKIFPLKKPYVIAPIQPSHNNLQPHTITPNSCDDVRTPKQTPTASFFVPDKMDSLFWCMYIAHYGESVYLAIGNKYGNAEIAEKQKIMEYLKANKYVFKNSNKKITLGQSQEIMSDLMTNRKTTLNTFIALSMYYKKNVLLLNENNGTYIEYISTMENWVVIKYTDSKKYGIFIDNAFDKSHYITDKSICIEFHDKPFRGISTYKIQELNEIAQKISDMSTEKKLSKPELYSKIWNYCLWV